MRERVISSSFCCCFFRRGITKNRESDKKLNVISNRLVCFSPRRCPMSICLPMSFSSFYRELGAVCLFAFFFFFNEVTPRWLTVHFACSSDRGLQYPPPTTTTHTRFACKQWAVPLFVFTQSRMRACTHTDVEIYHGVGHITRLAKMQLKQVLRNGMKTLTTCLTL